VQSVMAASMSAASGDGGAAALSKPLSTSIVPEPVTAALLSVGALSVLCVFRRRR
jgi:hypothetical protein